MTQPTSQVMRHVIAALVTNEPGVLAQVAGMFAARGFNIDSLVVGRTETPELSRMTIVVTGDNAVLEQVRKQLQKLVPVVKVVDYKDVPYVERDLVLVSVSTVGAGPSGEEGENAAAANGPATAATRRRGEIVELANLFRARIVDVSSDRLMVLMAGTEDKIEAFLDLMHPYGILEMARTGVIAMPRGASAGAHPTQLQMSAGRKPRKGRGKAGGGDVDATSLPPG